MEKRTEMPLENIYDDAGKCIAIVRDLLLGLLGLFCVVVATWMAMAERLQSASLLFPAGFLLLVFSSLSRFEFIKGLGIDLKMREINEKADQVERLAKTVAKTSTVTAEFCMDIMSRIGRFSGPMPRDVNLRLVRDMSTQLRALGVEKSTVDTLLDPWRNMVMFDLVGPARNALQDAILRIQQEVDQLRKDMPATIDLTSPGYLEYQQRHNEAGTWRDRINEIWNKRRGVAQIKWLEEVYNGLTARYGRSIIADAEAAEESIRHGMYFAVNKAFLDEGYWIDADPQKARLRIE